MQKFNLPAPVTREEKEAFSFIGAKHYAQENLTEVVEFSRFFGEHTLTLREGVQHTGKFAASVGADKTETLIEIVDGDVAAAAVQDVQEFNLEAGAVLNHVRLHVGGGAHALHRSVTADLAAGAQYNQFTLGLGSKAARTENNIHLRGDNAHVNLLGLNLLSSTQRADNWADIQFHSPNCTANVEQRQILNDTAHTSFQGKFHVHQAAQKTDAYMMCKSLLLGENARTSQKPELEIYADDVKCSHGTTTGQLDEEALFYLEARGIKPQQARAMLVLAFAQDLADKVPDDKALVVVKEYIDAYLGV